MRKLLTVLAFTTLCTSVCVHAQNTGNVRYRWHDAQNLPHYSDSLTTEAMKYGYDVVNDRGIVVQHVSRQLNAEERAVASKLAEQQAAKDHAAQEVADAEAQMLSAYPDEETYRISQQQALDTIDQQILTTQINLRSQEKALTDLLARGADMERNKETVPKYIVDGIAKQRDVVTGQRNTLTHLQDVRSQTVQQQAQQLQRYRVLKAAQLKGSQGDDAH
ncbi:DUF4124 domain-containing protein [Rhodanobacter sp. L36]|uniref:DUF4124 domain-containing protein n=1 Tax=Rhodanobacter sp. L36 TaxID=1747221 RepID=UPI00131CA087|nr:DUF4124 domain-containing protein [Rhodanobacter sp. L36]